MAAAKKTTTKAAAKTGTEKAPKTAAPKAEEKKSAETVEVKAPVKAEEEKPEEKKAAKKPAAQKAPAKKAELIKSALHVQFSGKSYAEEELVKMAKDVWEYDLNQKAGDLESLELYVKPEESVVYYVMNKEFTGSFYI